MFQPFHQVIDNVGDTIAANKKELGRPVIGVMPAYFPREIIYAAGGYPVDLWGNSMQLGKSDAYLQAFACSLARSVLELELSGEADMVVGYAFTSICDTLINMRELYRRLFDKPTVELAIPVTGSEKARSKFLKSVVASVVEGIEQMTGGKTSPESLAEAAEIYGRTRELLRQLYELRRQKPGAVSNYDFYSAIKAGSFVPAPKYNEMLAALVEEYEKLEAPGGKRMKLLLSGMYYEPIALMKAFDEIEIDIVDDDFANGWRTAAKATLATDDLAEGVSDYIFGPSPCCCNYNPDNDRHPYLIDKAKKCNADGVMFWYMKFCEPDAFDRPQLMEALKKEGIPAGFFEIELMMRNFDSIKTRISAFREILEG